MNKELEETLIHVLRMPDHWQKQIAKAMLPAIYKWQTRISLPHLSDEEFDRQWRAAHQPGLLRRMAHAVNGSRGQSRLAGYARTAEDWRAAVARGFRRIAREVRVVTVGRRASSVEPVNSLARKGREVGHLTSSSRRNHFR